MCDFPHLFNVKSVCQFFFFTNDFLAYCDCEKRLYGWKINIKSICFFFFPVTPETVTNNAFSHFSLSIKH